MRSPRSSPAVWVSILGLAVCGVGMGMGTSVADRDDAPAPKSPPTAQTKTDQTKPNQAKPDQPKPADAKTPPEKPSAYVLDHTMKLIDGTPKNLTDYKGQVILIVNTASKCGFTPQYAGLQKLYADKKDQGLVILAFPANDFGRQEPGTNAEIKEFCTGDDSSFKIQFPLFEKISVRGADAAPLYRQLAAQPAPIGGEPKWNFTKFLVDRSGNVVGRFESAIKPDDKNLLARIDDLLKAK